MAIRPNKHPFFKHGSLYCRHVLDQDSPLLRQSIRERIRECGGWPSDLNDPHKIRDCLCKDVYEINVTFNGISNLNAVPSFKMYSYKLSDIYIGFSFVKLGYISTRQVDGADPEIRVDLSLLHDIVPQKGGGSEQLGTRKHDPSLMSFLSDTSGE